MSYLPYMVGGAAVGLAARGRRASPRPPPMLDLHTIKLGPWTAIPAQTKPRWVVGGSPTSIFPLKLWNVTGPRKSIGLWVWWREQDSIGIRVKKNREWVGRVDVEQHRKKGERVWVVVNSEIRPHLRGTGIGSLMYLAARQAIEAYEGHSIKMIPTSDYLDGTGTSPAALKVWDRLRGEGRLGRRAAGLCFPFAVEMAQDPNLSNKEFFDKKKFQVVHGEVAPHGHGYYLPHAWVEKGGRVFDWQTREGVWKTMGVLSDPSYVQKGWPIREFYAQLKPRNMTTYTAEEAMLTCTYGVKHAGPWEPHEILPRR